MSFGRHSRAWLVSLEIAVTRRSTRAVTRRRYLDTTELRRLIQVAEIEAAPDAVRTTGRDLDRIGVRPMKKDICSAETFDPDYIPAEGQL
jgi:hypothetical protein